MKIKLATLSVFYAGYSFLWGDISVNDYLSFRGFVDASYTYLDQERTGPNFSEINNTDDAFNIEEIEVTALFDFEHWSARIDVEYEDGDNQIDLEQAYVDYSFERNLDGSKVTIGRYASMLGFEAFEPTGLYQYSNAYGGILGESIGAAFSDVASDPRVVGDADLSVFYDSIFFPIGERYSQGIRYTFENEDNFWGVSIQDSTLSYDNRLRGDDDLNDGSVDDEGYSFELAYSRTFIRIINIFLGGSYEVGEGVAAFSTPVGDTQTYTLNTYATCQLGAWLLAAEFNFSETQLDNFLNSGADAEVESVTGLLMANYAYNERASVTGRSSYTELDADGGSNGSSSDGDTLKYTVAHNLALYEKVFFITDFNYLNGAFDVNTGTDSALEEI